MRALRFIGRRATQSEVPEATPQDAIAERLAGLVKNTDLIASGSVFELTSLLDDLKQEFGPEKVEAGLQKMGYESQDDFIVQVTEALTKTVQQEERQRLSARTVTVMQERLNALVTSLYSL